MSVVVTLNLSAPLSLCTGVCVCVGDCVCVRMCMSVCLMCVFISLGGVCVRVMCVNMQKLANGVTFAT